MNKRKITLVVLLSAVLISAFALISQAADNATGGDGNTSGAYTDGGWYNPNECMWKVSLYVAKSDTASTSSNLVNDYYLVGGTSIYIKNSDWTFQNKTKLGAYNKVQYYNGSSLSYSANTPGFLIDSRCPKVPITSGGNIATVKSYFGDTNTVLTILNKLSEVKGTSQAGLVSGLNFTLAGVTKTWDSSYILPTVSGGSLQNRVAWVIVYEPVVVLHLKDKTTLLGFTATEYALAQKYGWYEFWYKNGAGQGVTKLTHCHLPTSVQLEYSWFGYPRYNVTSDSYVWTEDNIVKGGGWGMRFLEAQNIQDPIDFGATISCDVIPVENSTGQVSVTWRNYKSTAFSNIPCALYLDNKLIWSGTYNFAANERKVQVFNLSFGWGTTPREVKAQINYPNRINETDPSDNERIYSITPKEYYEFSISNLTFSGDVSNGSVYQGKNITLTYTLDNWNQLKTYTDIPIQIYYRGTLVATDTVNFSAYGRTIKTTTIKAQAELGKSNIEVRVNYPNLSREANTTNNAVSGQVNVKESKDFVVANLQAPTMTFENRIITITFAIANNNFYQSYTSIPVEILFGGKVLRTSYYNFGKGSGYTISYDIDVGEVLGLRPLQVRINWADRATEINANNNSVQKSVNVKRDIDFAITPIDPNAEYRAGTNVITSYNVKNISKYHMYPSENVTVDFLVYYYNRGSLITVNTQQKGIVIPANETNLVYFNWKVPENIEAGISIYCQAVVNKSHRIDEPNYANNTSEIYNSVSANNIVNPPNPAFSLTRPSGWVNNNRVIPYRSATNTLSWQEWSYDGIKFLKTSYRSWFSDTKLELFPDRTDPSGVGTSVGFDVRSGYSFIIDFQPSVNNKFRADGVTSIQRAELYYPEFDYSQNNKYSTLYWLSYKFLLPKNSEALDNGRKHFIPIWYSDGKYQVQCRISDCWTRATRS